MLRTLPPDLLCRIISEWLCLTSIPRLDAAHCCHHDRQEFLELAYGSTVQYHWLPNALVLNNTKAAQWIALRGLRLTNLVVDEWLLQGNGLLNQILHRSRKSITTITTREDYCGDGSKIDTAMVCIARGCPNLREVSIQWITLTDNTLKELVTSCPRLTRLEYRPDVGPHLSTRCISIISEGCFELEHLVWNNGQPGMEQLPQLSEATVQLARSHPKLKSLRGAFFCGIGDEALLTVATCCPSLQWLESFMWELISWPAMEVITQQLQLRDFMLKREKASDAAQVRRVIGHLLHLEELDIFSDQVTLEGYRLLSRCHNLRKLRIGNLTCHDACLEALAQGCINLRDVTVSNNYGVGDGALVALAEHCPLLTRLDFTDTNVTGRGIIALAQGCPSLQRVVLRDCEGVTNKAVVALAQRCSHLTALVVSNTKVGDAAVRALGQYSRHLDFLDLQRCDLVTLAGLQLLVDHCPSLGSLWLSASSQAEETALRDMFPRSVKVVVNGMEEADEI